MNPEPAERRSLVELVKHVLAHQGEPLQGITYQDLAFRIRRVTKHGVGHAHGMGGVLGRMGHLLRNIEVGWRERIPHIQCLAIQKTGPNKDLPDDGIKEFWEDYPGLSRLEKEHKVQAERELVAQFGSRWNTVLQQLSLPEVRPKIATPTQRGGFGGESPAHKALKEFVKLNPNLVGVDVGAQVFTEYALPSLDTIDVLFKTPMCWTAVEVKSAVSDGVLGDYERGVYQVVKYEAILRAMQQDARYLMPRTIKVTLVLEKSLPSFLKSIASNLHVEVLDNVKPKEVKTPS